MSADALRLKPAALRSGRWLIPLLLAVCGMPAVALQAPEAPASGMNCAAVSRETCRYAGELGRGINFGNMLEAPLEAGYGLWLQYAWIESARQAGFQHVRLPVRWSNHASTDAGARIDPAFLERVDAIVDQITRRGMPVVLDMHHYRQLDGDPVEGNEKAVSEQVVDERAVNLWKQIAAHYAGRHPRMSFELYNEPHGRLNAQAWNSLHPRLLQAVRDADPKRTVILGPVEWNSPAQLQRLQWPADRNVMATVHFYEPHDFTHQGAWGGRWKARTECCSDEQQRGVRRLLDVVSDWSRRQGVPVYVGEWGVHSSAPQESRVRYARLVGEELQRRAMPWAWWQLASDFGLYDTATDRWQEDLRAALMGPALVGPALKGPALKGAVSEPAGPGRAR